METIPFIDSGTNLDYVPIDVSAIPYQFQIQLMNRTYTIYVKYNAYAACYTLDLVSVEGIVLAYGEPILYGRPVFGNVEDERFPMPVIIPWSFVEGTDTVTPENLGVTVQLYMFDRSMFLSAQQGQYGYSAGVPDDTDATPIIPPMRPPSGGVDDEFAPYYHLHMIESIAGLPDRLAALGHAPIPLPDVTTILGTYP